MQRLEYIQELSRDSQLQQRAGYLATVINRFPTSSLS